MPFLTAIFLVLSLVLAVVIGPQKQVWLWGPCGLALVLASISALPALWRRTFSPMGVGTFGLGILTVGWFAGRAMTSPVAELGQADLLLLYAAVAGFIGMKSIEGHRKAQTIVLIGMALLAVACAAIIGIQCVYPSYRFLYPGKEEMRFPCGFLTYYGDAANFLAAAGLILLGAAACGHGRSKGMRAFLAVSAIVSLAAVGPTQSRAGMLSAVLGGGVLFAAFLAYGHRRKAKWFPLAAILLPAVGLALAIALMLGWSNAQEVRSASDRISTIMDGQSRLQLLSIATSCVTLHPWLGGGSRSFAWDFNRMYQFPDDGVRTRIPEYAHNEWIQAATDYGLIGLALVLCLCGTVFIAAVLRLLFSPPNDSDGDRHAGLVGGLAATTSMLVCGSFIFSLHLIPGALLLGIGFALACPAPAQPAGNRSRSLQQWVLCGLLVASTAWIAPIAWKGTRVSQHLIESQHGKRAAGLPPERKIADLSEAIRIWPMAALYQKRGFEFHKRMPADGGGESNPDALQAAEDYRMAVLLNPKEAEYAIARALLLSGLHRNADAEFELATELQGGMELVYLGHSSFATHLMKEGLEALKAGQNDAAIQRFALAAQQIERSNAIMPNWAFAAHGGRFQSKIHELHGIALERGGRLDEAMASYQQATRALFSDGRHVHLRIAMLLAGKADAIWRQRLPSKALPLFLSARDEIKASAGRLPDGITAEQRETLVQQLDRTIRLLQSAGIHAE